MPTGDEFSGTYLNGISTRSPLAALARRIVHFDRFGASDHWNFNVRFSNPGGNHGSFFRISTHSVWMMGGAGIPTQVVRNPYDSLNFASTVLSLAGHQAPLPDDLVALK